MCGHVGIAGFIGALEEEIFECLLRLDTVRGPHSTGIFRMNKENQHSMVLKDVGTPWDLELNNPKMYKNIFTGYSRVFMGHNRYATKGEISRKNAHPFVQENIVGCHNGTTRDQTLLKDNKLFDVDSENIFYDIHHNGFIDTVKRMNASYALVWFDKWDDTLNFARNHERTLYWCKINDGATLLWASEEWMLGSALHRSKIKIPEIYTFEPLTWYRLAVEPLTTYQRIVLDKFTCQKYEGHKYPVYTYPPRRGGNVYHGYKQETLWPFNKDTHNDMPAIDNNGKIVNLKDHKDKAGRSMIQMMGEEVEFTVIGRVIPGTGSGMQPYIHGTTAEGHPVRLHLPIINPDFKELGVAGMILGGTVNSFVGHGGDPYLKVKPSSVYKKILKMSKVQDKSGDKEDQPTEDKDKEDEGNKPQLIVGGTDNRLLSLEEYEYLTMGGCGSCSDEITVMDCDNILWIHADIPLCFYCADEYTKSAGKNVVLKPVVLTKPEDSLNV